MTHRWGTVATAATAIIKSNTPTLYALPMSSWEDHEEMIDDQYLMESIEEDEDFEDEEE